MHPAGDEEPCYVLRKVTLPKTGGQRLSLRLIVSGDPYEGPGRSDFVLSAGVCQGGRVAWFPQQVMDAGTPPDPKHWRTVEYPLDAYAGQTVGLVVRISYGGPNGVFNEEAFFDRIDVVAR